MEPSVQMNFGSEFTIFDPSKEKHWGTVVVLFEVPRKREQKKSESGEQGIVEWALSEDS